MIITFGHSGVRCPRPQPSAPGLSDLTSSSAFQSTHRPSGTAHGATSKPSLSHAPRLSCQACLPAVVGSILPQRAEINTVRCDIFSHGARTCTGPSDKAFGNDPLRQLFARGRGTQDRVALSAKDRVQAARCTFARRQCRTSQARRAMAARASDVMDLLKCALHTYASGQQAPEHSPDPSRWLNSSLSQTPKRDAAKV